MQPIVKELLEEIYVLEPGLREKEEKLQNTIRFMLEHIPKSDINPDFKKLLKHQVLGEIHKKKLFTIRLYWAASGSIAFCSIFGFFIWNQISQQSSLVAPIITDNTVSLAPEIVTVEKKAFGENIKTVAQAPKTTGGYSRGTMDAMPPPTAKMSTERMMIMPAYEPIEYRYIYTGSIYTGSGSDTVYRRKMTGFDVQNTLSLIKSDKIKGIDLTALTDANITNLNISEDTEYGYNVNVDLTQGTINFYQNYNKWPQPKCDENSCTTPVPLTEKDIPTDNSLIALADAFLTKYSIDRSLYGSPVVSKEWRTDLAQQQTSGNPINIPEYYSIIYPIQLGGKNVYEEYGGYKGITITIDVRNNRVSAANGIEKYSLIASDYPVIQDESVIRSMIQSGGRNITPAGISESNTGKIVDIHLSTPALGYVRIPGEWKDGISEDYFVPAYVFTIEDKPSDSYISNTVIIPRVEGFTGQIETSVRPIEPIMMR